MFTIAATYQTGVPSASIVTIIWRLVFSDMLTSPWLSSSGHLGCLLIRRIEPAGIDIGTEQIRDQVVSTITPTDPYADPVGDRLGISHSATASTTTWARPLARHLLTRQNECPDPG